MKSLVFADDQIEIYPSVVDSIRKMMEEYAAMMEEHEIEQWIGNNPDYKDFKSSWTWGICTLCHPERGPILKFEFGGEDDLPEFMIENSIADRFIVVTDDGRE